MKSSIATFILVAFCCIAQANGQLRFNLTSTGNADADAGFQLAADFWSSQFNDDIEVNLNLGFNPLAAGVLGQAGSNRALFQYSDFASAIVADSLSAADASFSSTLPSGNNFSVYINGTSESNAAFVDNDGGANNTQVFLNTANAKALGLIPATQGATDATITFNSNFNFDFDPSDGISAGQQDFVGVAIHEIGHALGFVSGVDLVDQNVGNGFNDDAFTVVNSLDFARHSPDSIANGADIDLTADTRPKFYSIDGGLTAGGGLVGGLDHFYLGSVNGDGRQASHWRDNFLGDGVQLGILDPTAQGAGNLNIVTALDLQAIDIIGYDFIAVPEPSSFLIIGGAFGAMLMRRRRA